MNSITGKVTVVASSGGIKIEGREGWLNPDERLKPALMAPDAWKLYKGKDCVLTLDDDGKICGIAALQDSGAQPSPRAASSPEITGPQPNQTEEMIGGSTDAPSDLVREQAQALKAISAAAKASAHAPMVLQQPIAARTTAPPKEKHFEYSTKESLQEKENYFIHLKELGVAGSKRSVGGKELTYVSWSDAWAKIKEQYPNAQFDVYENGDGMPYFADHTGGFVKVGARINGLEHISWLPIMGNTNKSIPVATITTFDTNKAIQRALVKALAYHGLGIACYQGEDLPKEE